jgi:hypothetical protein
VKDGKNVLTYAVMSGSLATVDKLLLLEVDFDFQDKVHAVFAYSILCGADLHVNSTTIIIIIIIITSFCCEERIFSYDVGCGT